MSRQIINNTPSGSGLGDTLYVATNKINAMTEELYSSGSLLASEVDTINSVLVTLNDGSLLSHSHTIAQIQNLQTVLDSKLNVSTFNSQTAAFTSALQTINDTLSDIIDILNTKVEEAPSNGTQYARQDGTWVPISGSGGDLSLYVPYSGSTQDVNLGEHSLKAGQVEFDLTPTGSNGVGILKWNDTDGTLDLGLKGGNVTLQVGQEQVVRVVNKTSPLIDLLEANYQVVKIVGATGQRLSVALAQANSTLNSAVTLGVVTETIQGNQEGFVTTGGQVREINTTGALQGETWNDGDVLYLSPTVAGRLTNIRPSAPSKVVIIGFVEYAHSQHGKIYVRIDAGLAVDDLDDVAISGSVATGDILMYSGSVWENIDPFDYFDAKPVIYQKHINMPVFGSLSHSNVEGISMAFNGSVARTWADTNVVTRTQRMGVAGSTTGTVGGQFRQITQYMSRNGGFLITSGFNMAENADDTAIRFFMGIRNSIGTWSNVEPDTLINIIGICRLSTSDNLQLLHNDGTGTATTIDLGSNFPANTVSTDKYIFVLKTVDSGVYFRLERVGTSFVYERLITSDLPASNLGMVFGGYIVDTSGANTTTGFDWYGTYVKI